MLTLLPDERRRRLVELRRQRGTARVGDLADDLGVSVITVRRDVGLLAERGLLRRVRGGATIRGDGGGTEIWTEGAVFEAASPGLASVEAPDLAVGMVVASLDYYWPDVIRGAQAAAEAASIKVVLRGGALPGRGRATAPGAARRVGAGPVAARRSPDPGAPNFSPGWTRSGYPSSSSNAPPRSSRSTSPWSRWSVTTAWEPRQPSATSPRSATAGSAS